MGNKYTLFFAVKEGRVDDLRWVLKNKRISPNLRDQESQLTPLHIACQQGHAKCVELLLETGAKVNARTQDSLTAVHLAVYVGHIDCLRLLLKYNGDVHTTARFGTTALHQAVYFEKKACAELLIAHNAPLDAQENFGMTPLAVAIREHKWKMARFLIDCGANVNICDYLDRNTPLHVACLNRSLNLVVLLLDAGASTNMRNSKQQMPLDIALDQGESSLSIILVLLEYGATSEAVASQPNCSDQPDQPDEGTSPISELVESHYGKPRTLKSFCRVAVRQLILRKNLDKSYHRRIPKALRDYIQEFG